jgi:hypothetical protein
LANTWLKEKLGRYFNFSESEIHQLDPVARQSGVQEPPNPLTDAMNSKGVFGGVDMFHSLHCLNALRKAVDGRSDEQFDFLGKDFMRMHMDHCIEQLRQAILCHGDLTPVTLTPVFNPEKKILNLVGQTEYPHTCRDWVFLKGQMSRSASGY